MRRPRRSAPRRAAASDVTLGTFHAICARMLRIDGDAHRRRPPLRHLRRRRPDDADEARRRGAWHRPQALQAARRCSPASRRAKSELQTPRTTREPHRTTSRRSSRALTNAIRSCSPRTPPRLRRPAHEGGPAVPPARRDVEQKYQERYLHVLVDEFQDTNIAQYAARAPARREARQHLRRRRPRPVDLLLALGRHPQHPQLRARLPAGPHRPARAELPLDADHPRRRARRHRRQPGAQAEEALDREGRRRADRHLRGVRRRGRGQFVAARDPGADRRRASPRRHRRHVPHERAVAAAGGSADRRETSATGSSAARASTSAAR